MNENDRVQCKLLAVLLEYPTASWRADLADLDDVVATVTQTQRRERLRMFLAYAADTPPLELQEAYTAAFDLDSGTSLHLTYHLLGDGEDRGKALARLLWLYHREGYDAAVGELPDYLPLVLEFLALCPEPEDAGLLWSCLSTVSAVAERLEKKHHPYTGLLGAVVDLLQPCLGTSSADRHKEA